MTRWWTGRAMGFDTETDDKIPEETRIISAAAVTLNPVGEPRRAEWLVQPERDIPQEAIDVHGITTEHAKEHGRPRGEAIADIVSALAACGPDVPLVGHNVSFDLTVLDREMRRLGLGSLGIEQDSAQSQQVQLRRDGQVIAVFPVIDTIVMDRQLDRYRKGPIEGKRNSLENTALAYRVPMAEGDAHDAANDVFASLRIAWRMAAMCSWPPSRLTEHYIQRKRPSELAIAFGGLRDMSLANLHCLQVKWAADQLVHLRQYFADTPEKGVNPDDVTGGWPFRPFI